MELARMRGSISLREAKQAGIHPEYLRRLCGKGLLVRAGRGLYRLADAELSEHEDLIEVCARVPHGVVCLLSALSFHGIGTELPHEVWLAIPVKRKPPKIDWPPLRIIYATPRLHSLAVEQHDIAGRTIRVYSIARTVVDCFRFRNKIGLDVAIEAARDVLRRRLTSVDEIVTISRQCRAFTVIRPYIEAML